VHDALPHRVRQEGLGDAERAGTTEIAIIPPTSSERSPVSRSGIAWSSTSRSRKGDSIDSPALRAISPSTVPSFTR